MDSHPTFAKSGSSVLKKAVADGTISKEDADLISAEPKLIQNEAVRRVASGEAATAIEAVEQINGEQIDESGPSPVSLKISDITIDPDVQDRAEINQKTVADYAAGPLPEFPPVHVWDDGDKKTLSSGHHTLAAHQKAGRTTIKALVFEGSKSDAILDAVRSNAKHAAERRTGADRRRAAGLLLGIHPEWSNNRIAAEARVDAELVASVRESVKTAQLSSADSCAPEKTRGKDDRNRPAGQEEAESQRQWIRRLLAKDTDRSSRDIAGEVGCSPRTVDEVRKEIKREASGKPPKATKPTPAAPAEQSNGEHVNGKPQEEEEEIVDAAGEAVPEQAKEAFAAATTITNLCREIDNLLHRIEDIAKGPGGRLIRFESVKQQFKDAKGNLWANRPTHVCPYCHGKKKDCQCCKGSGWTAKHIWSQAPGNNEKAKRA